MERGLARKTSDERRSSARRRAIAAVALVGAACGENKTPQTMTVDQLEDPATCKQCHQTHYKEWSGSMHAYASKDPVFRAMDARGQRETASDPAGSLGGFCVKCHAPMAYLRDPNTVPNKAHLGAYSELHDADGLHTSSGNGLESSKLCGSCHDIVVPAHFSGASQDVALERTYTEWQGSIFNQTGKLNSPNACGSVGCHTRPTDFATNYNGVPIADAVLNPGVKPRDLYPHGFPGIDVALTDFPERDAQRKGVDTMLSETLLVTLCVANVENVIGVVVENSSVGHNIPSGASQDRRMWLDVRGYKAGQQIFGSGVVPPGHSPTELLDSSSPSYDPNFVVSCADSQNPTVKCDLMRDTPVDKTGNPVDMFWQAASVPAPNRETMAVPVTADPTDARSHKVGDVADWIYRPSTRPDRVTLTIRIQPIGVDVLQSLLGSHDLKPSSIGGVDLDGGLVATGNVDGGAAGSSLAFANEPVLAILPNTNFDDAGAPPTESVTLDWNSETFASLGAMNVALNTTGPPSSCVYTAKRPM